MQTELAPIVLFAFDRPDHLLSTLTYLANDPLAKRSVLYIFCDGPKIDGAADQRRRIEKVREVVVSKQWAGEVIVEHSEINKGLAANVLSGVTAVIEQYDRVIVLEDDLKVGKYFLQYMNEALVRYETQDRVKQISGFRFPFEVDDIGTPFFMPVTNTIGWGTWKRVWAEIDRKAVGHEVLKSDKKMRRDFDLNKCYPYSRLLLRQVEKGTNDSWGILYWWYVFNSDGLVLYPGYPLIQHDDKNSMGVHRSNYDYYDLVDWKDDIVQKDKPQKVESNDLYFSKMIDHVRSRGQSIPTKVKARVRSLMARTFS